MHLRLFLTICCVSLWALISPAQTLPLSPTPQQLHVESAVAFAPAADLFELRPSAAVDTADLRALLPYSSAHGRLPLTLLQATDSAAAAYADRLPQRPEAYYLSVSPQGITLIGADARGTFYGIQTLLQLLQLPEVPTLQIIDYPDVADRGIVEGFYGNPWSERDRMSQFAFYAANKMNLYIYGPKDDPYHRDRWREPYPAESGAMITRLATAAHRHHVQFVWALHPGVDIHWGKTDRQHVMRKLESMYALGVRAFAFFFDDISGEGGDPERQADLLNYVTRHFIQAHHDLPPLILCPTKYNQSWAGDGSYLEALKQYLDPSVRIMWTGATVVDMINERDCDWFYEKAGRYPYIWLNYPVNDYCTPHLLMGPTFGNDLSISRKLAGFAVNPMEYAEASKLSIYSLADYAWNLKAYDAASSWHRAMLALMPRYTRAFRIFCENNVDLGPNGHRLRRTEGESPAFRTALKVYEQAATPVQKTAARTALMAQCDSMIGAADTLLHALHSPTPAGQPSVNRYLLSEIEPWLRVMRLVGERAKNVIRLQTAFDEGKPQQFIALYLENERLATAQNNIHSRNFEGSIKKPNPIVADVVVGKFIQTTTRRLVQAYKKKYDYRTDIFPVEVIDDGNYYILYDGRYLSNDGKAYPTFSTTTVSNINPQRQVWHVTKDFTTGRYKIANAYDDRVINELGNFSVNPYEAIWHTYKIVRKDGKYAIQNGGNGGQNFWNTDGQRLQRDAAQQLSPAVLVFQLVPVKD